MNPTPKTKGESPNVEGVDPEDLRQAREYFARQATLPAKQRIIGIVIPASLLGLPANAIG